MTPSDTPKPPAELWVVIDDVGQPEYAASYPEAAQEHINDWIENASDSTVKILGLGKYSSHRYILAPSPQESHKLAEELERLLNLPYDGRSPFGRSAGVMNFLDKHRDAILAALRSSPSEQEQRVAQRTLVPIRKAAANILYETGCLANMIEAAIAASGGAKGDGND